MMKIVNYDSESEVSIFESEKNNSSVINSKKKRKFTKY
jgi:hypothetical protein